MTEEQPFIIEDDFDLNESDEPGPAGDLCLPESETRLAKSIFSGQKEKLIAYCIAASLLLHVAAFVLIPRLQLQPSKSLLRPGEKVTPVRLVEFQKPPTPEPPPPEASAMADRNHTAEKERIPKSVAPPKPPLGTPEPPSYKMAAVHPPAAPEEVVREREERPNKPEAAKPEQSREKPAVKPSQKPTVSRPPKNKKADPRQTNPDLRITREDIARGFASQYGGSGFFPEGDADEAVIDINTKEDRFVSYLLHLKQKIEAVWVYPSAAAKAGVGGALTLEFSIAKAGDLLGVKLLDSSGHTILDESAVKAIKIAAPYHPLPDYMRAKRLRIRANFIYVTSDFFRRIM